MEGIPVVCPSQTEPAAMILDSEKGADYIMIQRFQAHKFRCFDNLQLEGLRRFNFLVGESGSGKSALLESIFLLSAASPELYFRIRRWRGFGEGNLEIQSHKESFQSIFRFLFFGGHTESIARLSLTDGYHGNRKLDIYFEGQENLNIPLDRPDNAFAFVPISFKWEVGSAVKTITLEIKEGSIKSTGAVSPHPVQFISPRNTSSRYDAFLFSSLSRSMKVQKVIDLIRSIYPSIVDLSLEISGGETLIAAQISGSAEKFPINDLSGGLNKLISIALAVASNPYGVILIDEIENGFYYKNYADVMSSLVSLCDEFSVQLFLSTHSREFLEAVAAVMEPRGKDVLLIKTRYKNGKCDVSTAKGDPVISTILQDVEVRA
jgi:ABC-type lipoprotein export system ATPase subunit